MTISRENTENDTVTQADRRPSPLFALFGAWFVWSAPFGTAEQSVFAAFGTYPFEADVSRLVLLISFVVSSAILYGAGNSLLSEGHATRTLWVCGALEAIGMLLGASPVFGAPFWVMYLGAFARGISTSAFVALWVDPLASLSVRGAGRALFSALTLYALLGMCIPAIADALPVIGAILLASCPLAACLGRSKLDIAEGARPRMRTNLEPISKPAMIEFLATNLVYGFLFGFMLNNFSKTGSVGLYGAFGVVALGMALYFALDKRVNDLSVVYRGYALVTSVALVPIVLFTEALGFLEAPIEAGLWSAQIFFTIIIFTDVEYAMSAKPWKMMGITLAFAGAGMTVAELVFPLSEITSLNTPALAVVTITAIMLLAVVYLPNGTTWVRSWGFSSFVRPESREAFLERRCADLAVGFDLTPRELEIVRLMARGFDNPQISDALVISPLTTKTHIRNIYTKLDVHTKQDFTELIENA